MIKTGYIVTVLLFLLGIVGCNSKTSKEPQPLLHDHTANVDPLERSSMDNATTGDIARVKEILNSHSDKLFVKRILTPEKYPVLHNPNGTYSTHSMAWGEADGKYNVYPTVILTKDGTLERLSSHGHEAWKHASSTGNYISFDTPQEAAWFSKNYKSVWR